MAMLTREQLLTADKLEVVRVEFDDGSFVYVRQITAHERDEWERSLLQEVRSGRRGTTRFERNLRDFRAKLAVRTICDEEGTLLLKSGDIEVLSRSMSAARLEKIIDVAQQINLIAQDDVEEMVKNFESVPSEDSTSESQAG